MAREYKERCSFWILTWQPRHLTISQERTNPNCDAYFLRLLPELNPDRYASYWIMIMRPLSKSKCNLTSEHLIITPPRLPPHYFKSFLYPVSQYDRSRRSSDRCRELSIERWAYGRAVNLLSDSFLKRATACFSYISLDLRHISLICSCWYRQLLSQRWELSPKSTS